MHRLRHTLAVITAIVTCTQGITLSFAPGTLVKTPQGYTKIEHLRIGDAVISYDPTIQNYKKNHIIDTAYYAYHSYVTIPIEDNICIKTIPCQLFFQRPRLSTAQTSPTSEWVTPEWVKAWNIAHYDIYTPYSSVPFYVVSVENAPKPHIFYHLLVQEPHTLCITKRNIIVHNGMPLLGIRALASSESMPFIQ